MLKNKTIKKVALILILSLLCVMLVKLHNLYSFYINTRHFFPADNSVNFIDFLIGVIQGQ